MDRRRDLRFSSLFEAAPLSDATSAPYGPTLDELHGDQVTNHRAPGRVSFMKVGHAAVVGVTVDQVDASCIKPLAQCSGDIAPAETHMGRLWSDLTLEHRRGD